MFLDLYEEDQDLSVDKLPSSIPPNSETIFYVTIGCCGGGSMVLLGPREESSNSNDNQSHQKNANHDGAIGSNDSLYPKENQSEEKTGNKDGQIGKWLHLPKTVEEELNKKFEDPHKPDEYFPVEMHNFSEANQFLNKHFKPLEQTFQRKISSLQRGLKKLKLKNARTQKKNHSRMFNPDWKFFKRTEVGRN